jgi:uncharacterized protein involved in outer membrane biogenesis
VKRVLALTTGAIVAALVAAAALLFLGVDLGFANTLIERQASKLLGREVQIGKAPRIKVGPTIQLEVGQISLANADWAGDEDLLTVENLSLALQMRSLFSGPILIDRLSVEGVAASIAVDKDGNSNLPLPPGTTADRTAGSADASHPLPVVLRDVQLSDIHVKRSSAGSEQVAALFVSSLTQRAPSDDVLALQASGTLQERPWTLEQSGSGINSLISGRDLRGSFQGSIAELALQGNYSLPDITEIRDLSLKLRAEGSLPPRIAELSPLLDAQSPMEIVLDVTDIDPGINVRLLVDLENLDIGIEGMVQRPGTADGLDLALTLDAQSLPRIAAALKLGPSAELPLEVSLRASRDGARVKLQDIDVRAGEHRISGQIFLPRFPATDNADISLSAVGPDFSFYQRLFKAPATLAYPYELRSTVAADPQQAELVESTIRIGEVSADLSGVLGQSPDYRNSKLHFQLAAPSLKALGESLALQLPDSRLRMEGNVVVSENAVISILPTRVEALGVNASLSGTLNSYPGFDGIDLSMNAKVDSLASTSEQIGLQALGDLPGTVAIDIQGTLKALSLQNLRVDAGGLKVSSPRGALRIREGVLDSDLELAVHIQDLPVLLGNYARGNIGSKAYSFSLSPRLAPELLTIGLDELKGPGVTGKARVQIARNLRIDSRTELEADLRFDDISQLVPEIRDFAPPRQPLALTARTSGGSQLKQIEARLSNNEGQRLKALVNLPDAETDGQLTLHLEGAGDDLRVFGTHSALPQRPLPYDINLDFDVDRTLQQLDITSRRVLVAGTEVSGSVRIHGSTDIAADLQIPRAELALWLPSDSDDPSNEQIAGTDAQKSERLIPDWQLPLQLLDDYRIDLKLTSGPLGLNDPAFSGLSLVDSLSLNLKSGNGRASLRIDDFKGARGTLRGLASITRREDSAAIEADMGITGLPIGLTSPDIGIDALPRYDASLILSSEGIGLRALAANLNAELLLQGGAGTLEDMSVSFATESFLAQLFTTLMPALKNSSPDMKVVCSVLAARASEGTLYLDPGFVFRSKRVDLSARGEIHLEDERLAIRFDNQARKGLGLSAASLVNPYVQITGTLARPSLGLDIASSALAGGAAVASGGLTVFAKPLFGRFISRADPCEVALKRWSERPANSALSEVSRYSD